MFHRLSSVLSSQSTVKILIMSTTFLHDILYFVNTFCGQMRVLSPAKINIYLHIAGVRDDGYHDLVSLFLMIGMYDTLGIKAEPGKTTVRIIGNPTVVAENDLMKKGVELFCRYTGESATVDIEIDKRIPIGAGLGGGSGNAAVVLLALNKICGTRLPHSELWEMAKDIGSDVPFFLQGPAALVTGRGENVESLRPPQTWKIILIQPDFSVRTVDAFRWYDESKDSRPLEVSIEISRIKLSFLERSPDEWDFRNSFSPVLFDRFPQYSDIEKILKESGACFTSISGSGSTIYGIFRDKNIDIEPLENLVDCKWWLKETLARTPYAVLQ